MKRHRRRAGDEGPSHERWLVSYADFITLLFAFFVVMFATSQTDKGKTQQLEDDINEASVQILNLVVANRQKVNVAAVGQPT